MHYSSTVFSCQDNKAYSRTKKDIDILWRIVYNFYVREGLMTVKEVLDHLRIGRTKFYALIKEGTIRTVKIGKRTLYDPEDIK